MTSLNRVHTYNCYYSYSLLYTKKHRTIPKHPSGRSTFFRSWMNSTLVPAIFTTPDGESQRDGISPMVFVVLIQVGWSSATRAREM